MILAVTGATGNMGQAVLSALETLPDMEKIRILSHNRKRTAKLLKKHKALRNKIEPIDRKSVV